MLESGLGDALGDDMAGYLFLLDDIAALDQCVESGTYATRIGEPSRGYWSIAAEGTFADYVTMRPGDNVYFFINRRIYGIGELVDVAGSCRHLNFPDASTPRLFELRDMQDEAVLGVDAGAARQRWVCFFRPSPHFFKDGVDMDDVLSSNPSAFRMLRAMWKVSFIKFDDEENQAFRDAVLKANQSALADPQVGVKVFSDHHEETHRDADVTLRRGGHHLHAGPIVDACAEDGRLRHEMAIEAAVLDQVQSGEVSAAVAFGTWDYLSHQVIASPFKPIDYMDKIDLFGYRYIPGYRPTISAYLVGEIKAVAAAREDIDQLLKYVDWVKDEYAHGDYSLVHAYLIASDFSESVIFHLAEHAQRMYTYQRRPARTETWRALVPVKYRYAGDGVLEFTRVPIPDDTIVRL